MPKIKAKNFGLKTKAKAYVTSLFILAQDVVSTRAVETKSSAARAPGSSDRRVLLRK